MLSSAGSWGAEIVGTTLSGYTAEETPDEPDLALVQCLSAAGCRVIAEGRYNTPAQAAEAMRWRRVGGDRRLGDYPPGAYLRLV
ncbi:N-acetylmannosamine-6-phosphate 2-epimerase [Klebsiella pneumoniae]|uniref:N-acylglucosamine-6-phosphate 2-epimerase n=1 Tax=Klebsiella pneumoniae TaxID=573 RepID=A0A378A5K5_KLEPN|nr:N-acetylmannosamine-6-phosphate 2-epimerase [Klebsiella pneumoniae]